MKKMRDELNSNARWSTCKIYWDGSRVISHLPNRQVLQSLIIINVIRSKKNKNGKARFSNEIQFLIGVHSSVPLYTKIQLLRTLKLFAKIQNQNKKFKTYSG